MHGLDDARARELLREWGRALDRLQEALSRPAGDDALVLDATIQRFEFCVELTWKSLQKLLAHEGAEAKTPRQALQRAYAAEWIDDESLWLNMLQDRNLTSHTYRESLAQAIFLRVPGYCDAMRRLHAWLVARYEGAG
ncbi:MAG: nucleotidyltransferase substrate binding protein [Magnetococcus sp. DMHC-8]